jgi:hypothetical protein
VSTFGGAVGATVLAVEVEVQNRYQVQNRVTSETRAWCIAGILTTGSREGFPVLPLGMLQGKNEFRVET